MIPHCHQILAVALTLVVLVTACLGSQQDQQSLVDRSKQNRLLLWHTNIEAPLTGSTDPKFTRAASQLSKIELTQRPLLQKEKPAEPAKPIVKAVEKPAPAKLKLPAKVLAQLKTAPPADVLDKVALADALFKIDYLNEAYSVYKHALTEASSDNEKGWLMFQMANCRFDSNPDQAGQLYNQLLQSQPDGIWSEAAKIQVDLITWRENHKPQKLLALVKDKAYLK